MYMLLVIIIDKRELIPYNIFDFSSTLEGDGINASIGHGNFELDFLARMLFKIRRIATAPAWPCMNGIAL